MTPSGGVLSRMQKEGNYAFIDSQNVHLAIRAQGWTLDWSRFRQYLWDKYGVTKAFCFMGYVPSNDELYGRLRKMGFEIILKPTLTYYKDGKRGIKGNVDAELVLHAMIEYPHYHQAIIASGDGDFRCLIEYLAQQQKLLRVLIPNTYQYSALLREFRQYFAFMEPLQRKLSFSEKRGSTLRTEP